MEWEQIKVNCKKSAKIALDQQDNGFMKQQKQVKKDIETKVSR